MSLPERGRPSQDTLRWSLPQGETTVFLFYTGSYEVVDAGDYHEARLIADTDTVGGEACISGVQKFCCSALFQRTSGIPEISEGGDPPRRIRPKTERPAERVRQHSPSERGCMGRLSGVSTARYLVSRERTGNAKAAVTFARKGGDGLMGETGLYAFGFNPSADNNLTIRVEMEDEDSAFNEQQTIDLTPWLRGFDGDELSLELDLHIGKELTIDDPVIIPEWEDTPETDLSNL